MKAVIVNVMSDHRDRPRLPRAADERGQALVEYALVLFLVAFVCIVALGALGTQTNTLLHAVVANF